MARTPNSPGALAEGRKNTGTSADGQGEKFSYIRESAKEGNERNMFEAMLAAQGVPPEESEPYRKALDSGDIRCLAPKVHTDCEPASLRMQSV